ncbi:MAG: efflux RND transporter periplasmic adaptor subunit [Aquificae bacterium]|nr:efflux RND transporter periplasmic adaptor subunit [Aquificota bacterium]
MLKILLLFFLLLFSCKEQEQKRVRERVVEVKVLPVRSELIPLELHLKGEFVPRYEAYPTAQVPGNVVKLYKREGQTVKKGEPLALVDPREVKRSISRAKEELAQAIAEYELQKKITKRRKNLYERELIAREEYERELTKLKTLRARVRALREELKRLKVLYDKHIVRSPLSGFIAERYVNEGDYLAPQQKAFRVVSLSPLEFVLLVPQRYADKLRGIEEIRINAQAFGDIRGKVIFVSPSAKNGQITLKALVQNPEGKIKPGMFGTGVVPVGEVKAFKVPENAVVLMGSKKLVWKIQNNTALPVEVKEVKTKDGYVYVLGNLHEGDLIAVTNVHRLREGARVRVRW